MSKMPTTSLFFKKQLYTQNKLVIEKWVNRPHILSMRKYLQNLGLKRNIY